MPTETRSAIQKSVKVIFTQGRNARNFSPVCASRDDNVSLLQGCALHQLRVGGREECSAGTNNPGEVANQFVFYNIFSLNYLLSNVELAEFVCSGVKCGHPSPWHFVGLNHEAEGEIVPTVYVTHIPKTACMSCRCSATQIN
ncbi:unnamed protein product [Ixodes pacificus]